MLVSAIIGIVMLVSWCSPRDGAVPDTGDAITNREARQAAALQEELDPRCW